MREMGHDEAVFDGSRFAFVRVANDVFHGAGLLAHKIPLHASRKAGSPHAAKVSGFQQSENFIPRLGLGERAHDSITRGPAIGIRLAGNVLDLGMRFVSVFTADGAAADLLRLGGRDIRKYVVVDGHGRSVITAAET